MEKTKTETEMGGNGISDEEEGKQKSLAGIGIKLISPPTIGKQRRATSCKHAIYK